MTASLSLLRPGMPPWTATMVACLSSFMVVTDGAIVNVALPAMSADLGLSAIGRQWVVDAYLLLLGGAMLVAARAGDLYGRRAVLLAGLALFTLASLAGGFATSGPLLLIARGAQGLGASALATSTLAVIVAVNPEGAGRERAISAWAASSALAAAFGVVIGGVLTDGFGWRWVMFVNVPVGVLLALMVGLSLARQPAAGPRPRLDLPGAASATLGLGLALYGVTQSVGRGWGAAPVPAALASGLAFLVLFVAIESRADQPLVRLGLFGRRNVAVGNIMVMGLGAALTAAMFFVAQVLQQIAGFGPLVTGLAMLPMALVLGLAAILSRPLRDIGLTQLPFAGGLVAAAGLGWLGLMPAAPDYVADLLGPTLLVGGGLGLMIMTATHAALAGIPRADAGLAAGLLNAARQLGGALGIAGLVTLAHGADSGVAGLRLAFAGAAGISALAGLASLMLARGE